MTPLPPTPQGEGLAYSADGRSVLLSTEGPEAPVHRLTLQAPAPAPAQGDEAAGADTGTEAPPAAATDAGQADGPAAAFGWLVVGGAVTVLVVGAVAVRRATRRGGR